MRFVLDDHLGRLARFLRALGYDALWVRSGDDARIVVASSEGRLFVTRDEAWSEKTLPGPKLVVRSSRPLEQLGEVIHACSLCPDPGRFLMRCTVCNESTRPIEKSDVEHRLPPFVRKTQERFRICPGCDRIYWQGTHVAAIRERLTAAGIL